MSTPKQILEGIRILDLTQWLAGPQATRLMVDLGAEVIKVELPPKGEHSRHIRIVPKDGRDGATPSYFIMHNRGKKSITLNVRSKKGIDLIKELVPKFDMLLQNFRPFAPRSGKTRQYQSPAHRLNQKQYHHHWLHNLQLCMSLHGRRTCT